MKRLKQQKLPQDWDITRLGSIITFMKKTKRRAGEGEDKGNYDFFTSGNTQIKFINECDFDGKFIIFGTGGNANIHFKDGKFSTSADCYVGTTTDKGIILKYIYYYLKANIDILEKGFKGAGLRHISKQYIENIELPVPPLEVQKNIVSLLSKAESTHTLRKESNVLSHQLLQSVFLAMFGDPMTNPMKWDELTLESLCEEIYRYPTFYGHRYEKSGIPVIRISNISMNGKLDPIISNYVFIDEKINNLFPRTIVEMNDILMAVRGDGSTGKRIGIIDIKEIVGSNISPNLLRFKPNRHKIDPIYLFYFMISESGQKIIGKFISRTSKKTITSTNIKKIKIPLPPIERQNKFAEIVNRIENLQKDQLDITLNLDTLFCNLQRMNS